MALMSRHDSDLVAFDTAGKRFRRRAVEDHFHVRIRSGWTAWRPPGSLAASLGLWHLLQRGSLANSAEPGCFPRSRNPSC